jgi:hypothetical protein
MRPISTRASRRRTLLAAIPITALLLGGAGAASASAATINVNPATGSSTNPGTPDKPLRTLEDALDRVKSGDTVRLAGGVYQERYKDPFGNPALLVPAGVTVQGEGNPTLGRTVLSGGGATVGLHLLGSAKINDILLSNFDDGLQAAKGTSTLKGVDFSASTLQLAGDARVTYTADQPDPAATERGGCRR